MEDPQQSAPASSYSPAAYEAPAREDVTPDADSSQTSLCENGNQFSCRSLGDEYATGTSIFSTTTRRVDWTRAIGYYDKACEHGDQDSCMILGREFRDGTHSAANPNRAFDLFKKACGRFTEVGCSDMRALSGAVGHLSYSNGSPILIWHCGKSWCRDEPLSCEKAEGSSCRTQATAFCATVSKGAAFYQSCRIDQNTCVNGLKSLVGQGAAKVSECTEREPTVPGQGAGVGWYCVDGFGSSACFRELSACQGTSSGLQLSRACAYQANAVCVVVYNVVSEKYESKCYPSLESCNQDSHSMQKDDYTEHSACFVAK